MPQAASRSAKSDMTASNAESWARLRLVQGESSTQKWELTATQGNATVTVGTSADCTWVVHEEGVRPIHFTIHWDGHALRVADVDNAGDVRVDGVLVGSDWRALSGRVRLEFGKAALVAESGTSLAPGGESDAAPRPKQATGRTPKGTLLGVAPSEVIPSYLQATPRSEEPKVVVSESESPRPRVQSSLKATLVGGITSVPLPTSGGPKGKNKANATLMGFNATEVLRGVVGTPSVQVGSSPPSSTIIDPDHGTVQGFPAVGAATPSSAPPSSPISGRRMTQQGVVSRPPGVLEGAVTHAPVRSVSESPGPRPLSIGSAWQEVPDPDGFIAEPTDPPPAIDPHIPPPPRTPRVSTAPWELERLSDLPTQMRDGPSFASTRRRPRRFPWRYVGVLLLTGVAYFAWLYLLDHW
jgi:predicted component of type VI protein secretion system